MCNTVLKRPTVGARADHIRTGYSCTIMQVQDDRCFCNFGDKANPFTWVKTEELAFEGETVPEWKD